MNKFSMKLVVPKSNEEQRGVFQNNNHNIPVKYFIKNNNDNEENNHNINIGDHIQHTYGLKKTWFEKIYKYVNKEQFENQDLDSSLYITNFNSFQLGKMIINNDKADLILTINALNAYYVNYITIHFRYI